MREVCALLGWWEGIVVIVKGLIVMVRSDAWGCGGDVELRDGG